MRVWVWLESLSGLEKIGLGVVVLVVLFLAFTGVMAFLAGSSDPGGLEAQRRDPRHREDTDPLPGDGIDHEQVERDAWKK